MLGGTHLFSHALLVREIRPLSLIRFSAKRIPNLLFIGTFIFYSKIAKLVLHWLRKSKLHYSIIISILEIYLTY